MIARSRLPLSGADQPTSFEEIMDPVRKRLLAERREQTQIALPESS